MTDPYRPPDAQLARSASTPPMWESFVTWGVAIVSICFSLLVWGVVAAFVLPEVHSGVDRNLMSIRAVSMLVLFSLPAPAGIALLIFRRVSVFFYSAFTLGMFAAFMLIGRDSELWMIAICALIFTLWTVILWSRGRFRRT